MGLGAFAWQCGLARPREIVSKPCDCDQEMLAASERNFSAWPRMPFAVEAQMCSGNPGSTTITKSPSWVGW